MTKATVHERASSRNDKLSDAAATGRSDYVMTLGILKDWYDAEATLAQHGGGSPR